MSAYGAEFDRLAETWAVVEGEHDKLHPERGECGGIGGCTMMLAAHRLSEAMLGELEDWRLSRG